MGAILENTSCNTVFLQIESGSESTEAEQEV